MELLNWSSAHNNLYKNFIRDMLCNNAVGDKDSQSWSWHWCYSLAHFHEGNSKVHEIKVLLSSSKHHQIWFIGFHFGSLLFRHIIHFMMLTSELLAFENKAVILFFLGGVSFGVKKCSCLQIFLTMFFGEIRTEILLFACTVWLQHLVKI